MEATIEETTPARSVSERTMMWKRIGKVFADRPRTAEEAIVEAGLDWDVELRQLGYKTADKKSFKVMPKNFVVVRTDTEAPLGPVKSRYTTFSNRHAFDFADNLVDGAGASFESGWEQGGGKVVGLTMKLPNHITVGGKDQFDQYLMLKTSHDGSSAIQIALQNMRMACLNQFNTALKNATRRWSVVHSPNAKVQLSQAREALELAFAYNEEFEKAMEQLMNTPIVSTGPIVATQIDTILKEQRVGDKAREDITTSILQDLWNSPTIEDDQRNTAYGLVNAVTEYFDHGRRYRNGEAGFKVTTEGLGARTTQTLVNQLLLVGA